MHREASLIIICNLQIKYLHDANTYSILEETIDEGKGK